MHAMNHHSPSPRVLARVALAALLAAAPGPLAAQEPGGDWPGFRGSLGGEIDGRLGSLAGIDEPGLSVAWRRDLGSGYSGIAVVGGRAVTAFSDGASDFAVALDAGTGAELWRYRIAPTYQGHDGSHDGPISTPLVAEGRVYGLGPLGQLFALDLESGAPLWSRSVAGPEEEPAPYYGFGTSPVLAGDVLVVGAAVSGHRGITGFDAATGEPRWSLESGEIDYQSPVAVRLDGEPQLVMASDERLYGLDPATGEVLWEYAHGGDKRAEGSATLNPVPAGENRLLVKPRFEEVALLEFHRDGETFAPEVVWTSRALADGYSVPVYHEGYFYGYRGSILTCVDAATGERVWRSRPPGDGQITLVDGHLLISTKLGGLHVARATPEGYREVARVSLPLGQSWTAVSFAGGRIYARGFEAVARVDLASEGDPRSAAAAVAFPESGFGRFLVGLEQVAAADRQPAVDAFLASVGSFPIVDGDGVVHFLYTGEADDMGIVGDMIGSRREDRMQRVPGTDLFHYSIRLEPSARVGYRFVRNLDESLLDPRNPRVAPDQENPVFWGELSWVSTPGWEAPAHLREPAAARGRVESVELETGHFEAKRQLEVYLPPGYDSGEERYPVVYLHAGHDAFQYGELARSLDNLVADAVAGPLIVVAVHPPGNPMPETWGPGRAGFVSMLVEEVVPLVDARYRTHAERGSRAVAGVGATGLSALFAAFEHPEVFGGVASQSLMVLTEQETQVAELLARSGDPSLRIYLGWGRYDLRGSLEGWDMTAANRRLAARLRERGYELAGGEALDGFGWGSWKNRTDRVYRALFPAVSAPD